MNICERFPHPYEYVYFTCAYLGRIFLDMDMLQEVSSISKYYYVSDIMKGYFSATRLWSGFYHSGTSLSFTNSTHIKVLFSNTKFSNSRKSKWTHKNIFHMVHPKNIWIKGIFLPRGLGNNTLLLGLVLVVGFTECQPLLGYSILKYIFFFLQTVIRFNRAIGLMS